MGADKCGSDECGFHKCGSHMCRGGMVSDKVSENVSDHPGFDKSGSNKHSLT